MSPLPPHPATVTTSSRHLQQPGFQMFIHQDIEAIELETALLVDARLFRRHADGWPRRGEAGRLGAPHPVVVVSKPVMAINSGQ